MNYFKCERRLFSGATGLGGGCGQERPKLVGASVCEGEDVLGLQLAVVSNQHYPLGRTARRAKKLFLISTH